MKNSVIFFVLFFMVSCAGFMQNSTIPPPRAGLTLLINGNQGVYAHCRLFNGYWSVDDLITADQDGYPKWTQSPTKSFEVNPSFSAEMKNTYILSLLPRSRYTLFVIYAKFTGVVLDMGVINFDTSANPYRSTYKDPLGQKIYADTVVNLPSVSASGVSSLRINKTIYPADWLKSLIGLP